MRLIFIRHAEPDYDIDSLTPKGMREAEFLSERVSSWDVDKFYSSPLGRAKVTASFSLKKMNRKAIVYDWLKEFYYPIDDPVTGKHHVPWDLMPEYYTKDPLYYDKDNWFRTELYKTNPQIETAYRDVCNGIDQVLSSNGYFREGNYYHVELSENEKDDKTFVFFCHLGVSCAILAHLIGVSPCMLWQGTYLAPSSVTVVNSEKRINDNALFRIQQLGSTSHLYAHNEPVSASGAFSEVFNG